MKFRLLRFSMSALLAVCAGIFLASIAQAAYEVPDPTYAPPTHYYDTATGTGFTLRTNLHTIISSGFVGRSYGDSRYSMATQDSNGTAKTSTDQDPNNPNHIILVYNRASITGVWDAGATWNREHVWPKFWLNVTSSQVSNTYVGPASDLFELRPADPNVNSSRNDDGYGFYPNVGTGSGTHYGPVVSGGTTYWYPGDPDAGENARIIFYMATRYLNPSNPSRGTDIQNLDLKYGAPALFNFGDLNSLLHWNYEFGVDNFERRRNQLIYGSSGDLNNHALNPNYYQGNRNPFVDHPEYVWAIFGKDANGNPILNTSQISVGTPDSNGASSVNTDLGRIMQNGTFGAANVTISKTGSTPTTYNLTGSGSGVFTMGSSSNITSATGIPFDFGGTQASPLTFTISAGLNASTAATGLKTGTIIVDNTDISTPAAAGQGSQDGNDTVNITGAVLANRTLTVAGLNSGRVMLNSTVNTTIGTLPTDPDDNNATRVNIANATATNADLSVNYAGGAATFNGPSQSKSLSVQFTSTGLKSNQNLNLATSLLSNGEAASVGATVQAANLNYTATVVSKRSVTPSQSSFNFGTVIVGATVGSSFNLTTTGDDNNRTRVNVDGNSTTDTNGVQVTGTTALFNAAASTSSRNIGGTLNVPGPNSGTLSLGVTTAENSGSGLTGEGSYSSISIGYSATVMSHANASFSSSIDADMLSINLGSFPINSSVTPMSFDIDNLVTTLGYTEGLKFTSVSGTGDTAALTTNLAPFTNSNNLAAGSGNSFLASLNTNAIGSYSASYTVNLFDADSLPGAAAQSISLMLTGTVTHVRGDLTLDNQLSPADVQELMVALSNVSDYQSTEHLSPTELMDVADVNDDGSINNLDIQALITMLANGSPPSGGGGGSSTLTVVPEPSSLLLLCIGGLLCSRLALRKRLG